MKNAQRPAHTRTKNKISLSLSLSLSLSIYIYLPPYICWKMNLLQMFTLQLFFLWHPLLTWDSAINAGFVVWFPMFDFRLLSFWHHLLTRHMIHLLISAFRFAAALPMASSTNPRLCYQRLIRFLISDFQFWHQSVTFWRAGLLYQRVRLWYQWARF